MRALWNCYLKLQIFTNCFYILLFIITITISLDTQEFQRNLPEKVVWALLKNDAELPCDVTPPVSSDRVRMIFWFKNTIGMPIYSLDARDKPLSRAPHLAMSDDLGSRFFFIADDHSSKARLRIKNITEKDEGIYRCRVDFINSPTRNFQVNLSLIVQPSMPRIFDSEGNEIKLSSNAGPFLEDHELFLSCQVTGGRPRPTLIWWYNNTILDGVVDSKKNSYTIVNQLIITKVPRHMKRNFIECRASSAEIADDVIRKISLIIYLKPQKVKIQTENNNLVVFKSNIIRCETFGSYPPAKLSWQFDNKPLNYIISEEETDVSSISVISLNVTVEDDNKILVCRADNSRFPGGYLEDRYQIRVAYPPRVSVLSDKNSSVSEGQDVVLRCQFSSNPTPHSFSWYHNGHLVAYNKSGGVIPNDNNLFLYSVRKISEGHYACSATNSEGETYSSPFDLKIEYTPRCKKSFEKMQIAFVPHEILVVKCYVDSMPKVKRFSWTYNTSKGVFPVHGSKIQNDNDISTLYFIPDNDEVEALSCWAVNDVGTQKVPCLFYINPADYPEMPRDCKLENATYDGLQVICEAGNDGGLKQSFVLEVRDVTINKIQTSVTVLNDESKNFSPIYRVLGEKPLFRLHSLQAGKEYQLVVYAENLRGRSPPSIILPNIKVEDENHIRNPTGSNFLESGKNEPKYTSKINITIVLVALSIAGVLLILCIIITSSFIACRKSNTTQNEFNTTKTYGDFEMSEAGFDDIEENRRHSMMYGEYQNEFRIPRITTGPDLILAPVSLECQHLEY